MRRLGKVGGVVQLESGGTWNKKGRGGTVGGMCCRKQEPNECGRDGWDGVRA